MAQGKLIVFEGTDGSGKGTQLDLLLKELSNRNKQYEVMDFPRYSGSVFGELAGRMLKGEFGSPDMLSSELAVLPFACDRWLIRDKLLKWLEDGKLVISNRYTASSAVYQAAKLPLAQQKPFIDWVYSLEQQTIGLPKEDIVIFFHMPLTISEKLIEQKDPRAYLDGKKKDIYEEDDAIQVGVNRLYHELAESNSAWHTIACSQESQLRSKEAIQKDILDVLMRSEIL
jgi:dTMP kinase